jgi:EAL domain-containing protein (putative c-di-GMP-specific phosphodiesterase class I)
VYSADRDDNDVRRLTLITELRRDISEGRLDVHHQPLVDLTDGRIVHVECLVRWTSTSYGPVSPDEFIPMAETTGLIEPLTELVLERSLARCARWRADGYDFGVAVNLSVRNLLTSDLPALVARHLAAAAVPGEALTLELTESCLIGDVDRTAGILTQLRALGARVSIDDFGTGYSSLSYLSKLPVDELKIDRSFVMAMGRGGGDSAIVRAATHLAHDLGLTVVAEGVEDVDTWRSLAAVGCDVVQGYLVSRPQPAADLTAWLARHRRVGSTVFVDVPGRSPANIVAVPA